ncbi:MAG: methylglyoxal synthase [Trebonia sp.]|jgi:methylglyoxal synthase|nr:methylglyoxal synthase [Trebonia sp.]
MRQPGGMTDTTSPDEYSNFDLSAGVSPSNSGKIRVLARKRIALVAHDYRKGDLLEWAEYNRDILANHTLYATGTTGRLLGETLDLPVTCFQSGPLGGDQQIGALIASGRLDMLIFFWDPMSPQPHDSDVKALVRIAVVWNIPIACNRTSADYFITSPLLGTSGSEHAPLAGSRG